VQRAGTPQPALDRSPSPTVLLRDVPACSCSGHKSRTSISTGPGPELPALHGCTAAPAAAGEGSQPARDWGAPASGQDLPPDHATRAGDTAPMRATSTAGQALGGWDGTPCHPPRACCERQRRFRRRRVPQLGARLHALPLPLPRAVNEAGGAGAAGAPASLPACALQTLLHAACWSIWNVLVPLPIAGQSGRPPDASLQGACVACSQTANVLEHLACSPRTGCTLCTVELTSYEWCSSGRFVIPCWFEQTTTHVRLRAMC
jgi:hypothetical protein